MRKSSLPGKMRLKHRSGRLVLPENRRAFPILIATALCVFPLPGCVSLPGNHRLLLNEAFKIVARPGVDCGSGWQELTDGPEELAALDSDGFSLLSWNAHKGRDEQWPEDFKSLIAGSDLVLLQEAHLTPGFRSTLNTSGLRWLMARAYDYAGAETGVLTASQVSASAACIRRTTEPLIRVPKSTLLTRYRLSGSTDELWVVNLHGVNFTFGTEGFQEQLETLAAVLAPYGGPLIVAGDFNDWSRERDDILRRFALKLGLTDVRFSEDRRSRHLGAAVDHVFFRGLDVLAAKSVAVESSDHHPILARFRYSDDSRKEEHG